MSISFLALAMLQLSAQMLVGSYIYATRMVAIA